MPVVVVVRLVPMEADGKLFMLGIAIIIMLSNAVVVTVMSSRALLLLPPLPSLFAALPTIARIGRFVRGGGFVVFIISRGHIGPVTVAAVALACVWQDSK